MNGISLNGVLNIGPYKGYWGRAEYDSEASVFHGEVIDTKDVITFAAPNPTALVDAFRESIDDYLAFCAERGEEPDKPYSGRFLVRTPPELHRQLANKALRSDISLNQLVVDVLAAGLRSESLNPTQ